MTPETLASQISNANTVFMTTLLVKTTLRPKPAMTRMEDQLRPVNSLNCFSLFFSFFQQGRDNDLFNKRSNKCEAQKGLLFNIFEEMWTMCIKFSMQKENANVNVHTDDDSYNLHEKGKTSM